MNEPPPHPPEEDRPKDLDEEDLPSLAPDIFRPTAPDQATRERRARGSREDGEGEQPSEPPHAGEVPPPGALPEPDAPAGHGEEEEKHEPSAPGLPALEDVEDPAENGGGVAASPDTAPDDAAPADAKLPPPGTEAAPDEPVKLTTSLAGQTEPAPEESPAGEQQAEVSPPDADASPATKEISSSGEEAAPDKDAGESETEVRAKPGAHGAPPFVPREPLKAGEKLALVVLAAGILLAVGVAAYLIRGAFPSGESGLPVNSPKTPLAGEFVTIEGVETGWVEASRENAKPRFFPQLKLALSTPGNGAVRLFFRDGRNRQMGDTVNLEVTRDTREATVNCTDGIDTVLEFSNNQVGNRSNWTVQVFEGPDRLAPGSEFQPLVHLNIPWNLKLEEAAP